MTHIQHGSFSSRHIGIAEKDVAKMLDAIGVSSIEELIDQTVPEGIRYNRSLKIPEAISEFEYLKQLKLIAAKNKVFKSLIGQGYYGTITPSVLLRNIFQNPGWYTQYTPYQAEISQGRLEALLNFQTIVSDLTGLPIANASLLDEGTAAAEAMAMFYSIRNKRSRDSMVSKFFVDRNVFHQTLDVLKTRAKPWNIELVIGDWKEAKLDDSYFGVLLQYPDSEGRICDYSSFVTTCHDEGIYVSVCADLLSLSLLKAPGEWNADAVVGNTQRFGVPMGYGGPHAAYFATKEDYKRQIPGRIIGVSQDRLGNPALRMALQTREQHIRREKATSNICTAQALLAIMAGMYGVYHGPDGLKFIAARINNLANSLAESFKSAGWEIAHNHFFDTIRIKCSTDQLDQVKSKALGVGFNFYYGDDAIQISMDETCDEQTAHDILKIFDISDFSSNNKNSIPAQLGRQTAFMEHDVFHSYHSETEMMRYLKRLENKDISLVHSMIPLGSCTMKLNAATQLIPVSWAEFSEIHPFAPEDQCEGYKIIFDELESYLSDITGFAACSLQPNSGAQGEFAGLLVISAYHEDRGDSHRNIALIPSSAHGTNPASAVLAGYKVVVVKCDDHGNIDLDDLRAKAEQYKDVLAALMVTYPSTHGVFESEIIDVCKIIHDNGGMVYMDGANMNAQVGLTDPHTIGADVCHLNLHKTFSIPHGGGGPGMGPICVNEKLAPFLPGHVYADCGGEKPIKAVSSAPWGSPSILLISHAYIKMLGNKGVTDATKYAILNANYIKSKLESHFQILYVGEHGRSAHELIVDLRPFKSLEVSAEDVAKRLIDYGFHAPTLSFPVAGTIMIEPTESESKAELDRFCDAMIQIKKEIDEIATGAADPKENVLHNAPHVLSELTADHWNYPYSREKAAYPLAYLKEYNKIWSSVARVDNAYGDRHLICTCPPIEAYEDNLS